MTDVRDRIASELLLVGKPFPPVPDGLPNKIREFLDGELNPLLDARPQTQDLPIWKSSLTSIHQCEGLFTEQLDDDFEISTEMVVGMVTHLAIQLQHQDRYTLNPKDYVEAAAEIAADDSSSADWYAQASDAKRLHVEARATSNLEFWADTWPRMDDSIRVQGETRASVRVANGRVRLIAKPDLVIGPIIRRDEARQAIIDLKTQDRLYSESREEAWYYALVYLLRFGTAPHSSIIYSIPTGEWHPDPRVTEDHLMAASRRVVAGVRKMLELSEGRKPNLTPTPATYCQWCPAKTTCEAFKRAS